MKKALFGIGVVIGLAIYVVTIYRSEVDEFMDGIGVLPDEEEYYG